MERGINVQELEYLRNCSDRVRELDMEAVYSPYIIDDSIAQAFSEITQPLFPKLRVLGWYTRISSPSMAQFQPFYPLLLAPRVTRVHLKGGLDARCLNLLPSKCTNMDTIVVEDKDERSYHEDYYQTSPSCFPFGWSRWCLLVPTLRHLSLQLNSKGTASSRFLWRQMPVWALPIRYLQIETSEIGRAADFLAGARLEFLTSLKIRLTKTIPRCQELHDLFDNLFKACFSKALQEISIFKDSSLRSVRDSISPQFIITSFAFDALLEV